MTNEQLAALKQRAEVLLRESGELQTRYQRKTHEWHEIHLQVQEEETRRKYFQMFNDEARNARLAMETRIAAKDTV